MMSLSSPNYECTTYELLPPHTQQSNSQILEDKPKLFTNKTLCEFLDVSDKTLKKYRDEGQIGYSQVNDKFWYTQEDIDTFLKKHYQATF